jgi:hypothetical protein
LSLRLRDVTLFIDSAIVVFVVLLAAARTRDVLGNARYSSQRSPRSCSFRSRSEYGRLFVLLSRFLVAVVRLVDGRILVFGHFSLPLSAFFLAAR